MKIYKCIQPENILLDIDLKDKNDVLHFVADTFSRIGAVTNAQLLYESMAERERTMSTGIGSGICIPHATSLEATRASLLLIRPVDPVDFDALDGLPVEIILALVVPENQTPLHLQILAGISRLCQQDKFMNLVRRAAGRIDLLEGIQNIEKEIAFH